jgi:hypothetical protein
MSYTRFVMGCGLRDPLVYQPKASPQARAIAVVIKLKPPISGTAGGAA